MDAFASPATSATPAPSTTTASLHARTSIGPRASAGDVRVMPGACGSRFGKFIMGLRAAALARIEQLFPEAPFRSGMMQAVLIGQTFQLQKVWTEQWRSTGTFHALVISGA